MKKIILIIIVFSFLNSKSQTIDSLRVSNGGVITAIDTIYLKVYATNGDGGYLSNTSYSLSGPTVDALVKTCSGGLVQLITNIYALIKINPLSIGTHKIKVVMKDYDNYFNPGCSVLKYTTSDSINIDVQIPNAINEIDNTIYSIKSIPNPFQNIIKLNFAGTTECNISILDNIGRVVYNKNNYRSNQELDLSFLTSGVYFLKTQNNSGQRIFKIIKSD